MLRKILKLLKKDFQTLNLIEVSKANLIHNYKYLSSLNSKVKVAAVVKSNGYGHGIINVAKVLEPLDPPFFCVDSLFEAYELLKANITIPILIMGYTNPQNFKVKKLPFSYAIFDLELAKILNKYQQDCKVHIFIDSGMHREGIPVNELPEFLQEIKKLPNLKLEGLMSHLASADDKKDSLNKIQVRNFKKALRICQKYMFKPKWIHLQNSDGLAFNLPGCRVNMARVGLALYGISSDPNLKPTLTLKSKIIQTKNLQKGDRVGYSGTFAAKRSMTIGILPLGYYEGVDRRLSNKGWVLVDGKPCKVIGKVSMNITTVDLSNIQNPFIGQEIIVYSNNPKDKNSVENVARLCRTIPYDILIGLSASIKRVIV